MFKNRGIAFRLRFYILFGIFAIFAAIMFINYGSSRDILMKMVRQNASNLALSTVNTIENVLNGAEKIPENLAPILENIEPNENQIKKFLEPIVRHNKEVFGACVSYEPYSYHPNKKYFAPYYFKDGDSASYKVLGGVDYEYFYLDWYQIPKMLEKPVWTEPYFDENGGNIIMSTYSVPFYKRDNGSREFNGIVTVDIDMSWLKNVIDSIDIVTSGYAFLISKKGTFLTHPVDSLIMNESIFSLADETNNEKLRKIGKSMIAGETNFIKYNPFVGNEDAWLYYTESPSSGWSIGIIFPEDELFADLHSLFLTLLALAVGGLILIFFVITVISNRITRPIEVLAGISEDIGTGNFDVILPPIIYNDEIGRLTHSFEVMKEELKNYIRNLEEATAARNKIESELKIAHDIQQGIIPKIFPPFPDRIDVDLYAILDPAKEVGGDLYEFFFIDDETIIFAVGDVSGKGVPASLFMAITRTLLRAKAEPGMLANEIVTSINKELCKDNDNAMFVTFFLGLLSLKTGELNYCNAGHNYPYILRKNHEIQEINQTHGTPLGLFEDMDYKIGNLSLNKEDSIVLYTDGIPEAMDIDGNLFGDDRLEEVLKSLCCEATPEKITKQLLEVTKSYAGEAEQSDDITILVLTYYLNKHVFFNINEKHLTVVNKVEEITKVEDFIEHTAREWKLEHAEARKVNLAAEEIVSNIINYGYGDENEHKIKVVLAYGDGRLKAMFSDDGVPFNPTEKKDPDSIDKPIEEREIGGLGIFFVMQLMDKVEYKREGNMNILIIEKVIKSNS